MAEQKAMRRRRVRMFCLIVLSVALGAAVSQSGRAQHTGDLYQETVITTGSDLRYRAAGFGRALRAVLVKVSGEPRLQRDARVDRLAAEANLFVASFSYVDQMAGIKHKDDQGTYDRPFNLTVHFVPARIDKAITDLGAHPWRGARPVVVPVVAVHSVSRSYLLSADGPAGAEQRTALADVAREFVLRVRFPTEAELAGWHATVGGAPSPPAAASREEAVVAGTLEFQQALPGWVGSWRMRWHGKDYAWSIRGVNFDQAFRSMVAGVARVASGHGAPD